MDAYLVETNNKLSHLPDYGIVKVVMGNEACDLDSAVCSLVYAYFLQKLLQAKDPASSRTVLPVLNVPKSNLHLHTEVTYSLAQTGIPQNTLICRDDIDLLSLHKKGCLELYLVDHNALPFKDSELEDSVVEVIDHHQQESKKLKAKSTIISTGSCCTIVFQKIMESDSKLLDTMSAKLLYGTILLDTVCLDKEARRATVADHNAIMSLETMFQYDRNKRKELFESIQDSKNNCNGLTPTELLQRDMKTLSSANNARCQVAISSLPILAETYFALAGATEHLIEFSKTNKYIAVVIMGIKVEPITKGAKRDIAIYSTTDFIRHGIVSALTDYKQQPLCLKLSEKPIVIQHTLHYVQGNTTTSRKIVLPILKQYLNTITLKDSGEPRPLEAIEGSLELSNINEGTVAPTLLTTVTAFQGSTFLGVGEPISQSGSAVSSAYNSCPYTPQNSCTEDDGLDMLDPCPLPTFNSRDMMEMIEQKRGKLRGYEDDEYLHTNYPFTPKNSFVDSNFESAYQKLHAPTVTSLDSEAVFQKLKEKTSHIRLEVMEEPNAENAENTPPWIEEELFSFSPQK